MGRIKEADYNAAKGILTKAGSKTASKSHAKHNTDGTVEEDHGKELLREARDEFRKSNPGTQSGMEQAQYDAIHKAAGKMGISSW
jgi:hypothetical protein